MKVRTLGLFLLIAVLGVFYVLVLATALTPRVNFNYWNFYLAQTVDRYNPAPEDVGAPALAGSKRWRAAGGDLSVRLDGSWNREAGTFWAAALPGRVEVTNPYPDRRVRLEVLLLVRGDDDRTLGVEAAGGRVSATVAGRGVGKIVRFDLPQGLPTLEVTIGAPEDGGPVGVGAVQVSPLP